MFSNREKAKEARREVTYRQFVYSKRMADGKMTEKEAKQKIAMMEEIAADYDILAVQDEAEERLF